MTDKHDKIVHFAIRVPLITRIDGKKLNTIDVHNEIIRRLGRVALAKFGNPGKAARVETIKKQIEQGAETLLVLITKKDNKFSGHQSPLSLIHLGSPTAEIQKFTPEYYDKIDKTSDLYRPPELWFTVDSPFVKSDLTKFRLSSNHRPLLEVIIECRTSAMLIEK